MRGYVKELEPNNQDLASIRAKLNQVKQQCLLEKMTLDEKDKFLAKEKEDLRKQLNYQLEQAQNKEKTFNNIKQSLADENKFLKDQLSKYENNIKDNFGKLDDHERKNSELESIL